VGTTDSEHAFCWILGRLYERWAEMPSPAALRSAVDELSTAVARQGVFNMLLSDGKSLYCYRSTNLVYLTRRAPFGAATLIDDDLSVDFSRVTSHRDVVTIVATRPLTRDEAWVPVEKGGLVVFRDGNIFTGRTARQGRAAARAGIAPVLEDAGASAGPRR
jgi:glutamine amidotransferase